MWTQRLWVTWPRSHRSLELNLKEMPRTLIFNLESTVEGKKPNCSRQYSVYKNKPACQSRRKKCLKTYFRYKVRLVKAELEGKLR